MKEIPIEERSGEEVTYVHGLDEQGQAARLRVTPQGTKAANPAFDVTPARLVSGLLTERGRAMPVPKVWLPCFPIWQADMV